jgi:hypothetical protein
MTERVALLLYWRIPHGRRIVRGYAYDRRGVVDIQLPGGWSLSRWDRRSWRLERPQRIGQPV